MHVYIIDNYDSFTYNLYQLIGECLLAAKRQSSINDFQITVQRNDAVTLQDIATAQPDCLILSPGPGHPANTTDFALGLEILRTLSITIPTLGVCLGMQGIAHAFGGQVIPATVPMHGKQSQLIHHQQRLFTQLPIPLEVMRYHSLCVSPTTLPGVLQIDALTRKGPDDTLTFAERLSLLNTEDEIMAISHKHYPIYGVQYHPESFASEGGKDLIQQFLAFSQQFIINKSI